jgi:hypothetical protein
MNKQLLSNKKILSLSVAGVYQAIVVYSTLGERKPELLEVKKQTGPNGAFLDVSTKDAG